MSSLFDERTPREKELATRIDTFLRSVGRLERCKLCQAPIAAVVHSDGRRLFHDFDAKIHACETKTPKG